MNINSLNTNTANMGMRLPPPRPSTTNLTDNFFSKLDTAQKGYIDKNDLKVITNSNSVNSDVMESIFTKLDNNGDGKLTKVEMKTGLDQIIQANNPAQSNRPSQSLEQMPPMGGGMPPPPPRSDNQENSTTVTSNYTYSPADTNGDGQVSATEQTDYYEKIKLSFNNQTNVGNTVNLYH